MLKQKMRIIKIGINGEGIGYVNKIPVFVEGALVDELVEIEILENFGSYMKAKTVRVIEKSPFRVKPRCSLSEKCGGCSMMICDYKKQLEYKKELLRETLKKYANIDGSIIEDVVPNPTPFNYRNQCKLPVKWLKGTLYSGMYEANSSRLVYMDDCQVHEKGLDKTRMAIMKVLNKYGFRDYNDQIERGIRTIVLRGFDGKYQCTLVTGKMKIEEEVIEEIMNIEGVKSLYQSVNISKKNIETFGKEFIH
ncbi:MAG: 23S rRNA (uracil(1939)-C(5))-methyltransferase RlmD, partial [Anaerorhabdus sp.]